MDAWVNKPGFPVVNVTRTGCTLYLTQERFVLFNLSTVDNTSEWENLLWQIQFTYKTQDKPKKKIDIWIKGETHTHNLTSDANSTNCSGGDWIKGNIDRVGLYRVNYDLDTWEALADQLSSDYTVFSTHDRVSLLDDALALARVGYQSYKTAFKLLNYISREIEDGVWAVVVNHFRFIQRRLRYEQEYRLLFGFPEDELVGLPQHK
ncbi:aminopeptidase [Elysia marginata]|uniref:Aminopeptidase n=1 Tax=Elysia marginata TaxID=1093978 RepID=A0AAV4FZV3_9GAST|nr:aminopeptidase [Elysia marginata]